MKISIEDYSNTDPMLGGGVPAKNTKGSNMLDTLTVTVKHPKLGEDVSTLWRKHFADYFESQITYVGGK